MRKITDIYKEYKIMPSLQEHMLRVAAVASLICDNFNELLPKDDIVVACLLHDMGNIIKSDLNYFPEFVKPEGLEYWQKVKNEYIKKYSPNEHTATEAIAKEINMSEKIRSYIKNIGFSNSTRNEHGNIFEHKICSYADMRVDPHRVVPMEDRISEGHKRYQARKANKHALASDNFESLAQSMKNIEKQIFAKCKIKPEDINDDSVKSIIEKLRNFEI